MGAGASGPTGLVTALAIAAVMGALIVGISQFLTLYHTHIAARRAPIAAVTVGSAHAYALLPIAGLAIVLAYGVWSIASRPALLSIGALGLIALLISLIRDLPDANRSGVRALGHHYVLTANTPALGLYAETLGAMILLIMSVGGFILLGPPARRSTPAAVADPAPVSDA